MKSISPLEVLSDYVLHSRYLNYLDWENTVKELFDIHREYIGKEYFSPFDRQAVVSKVVFPSMRSIQYLRGFLSKNTRMYNCVGMIADHPRLFRIAPFLLLSGCGVGVNILPEYVEKLPRIKERDPRLVKTFRIEDDILGWSDSIMELFNSYVYGYTVQFDYSQVEAGKGTLLRSCGRPHPGSEPLRKIHRDLEDFLDSKVKSHSFTIRPIDVFDFICIASQGIVSSGVRRSALIFVFDKDDDDMKNAKVGEWWRKHPHRAMANISMVIEPECRKDFFTNRFNFDEYIEYGEPGIILIKRNQVVNPCAEVVFEPWIDGCEYSCFQFCNLVEINLAKVTNRNWQEVCMLAWELAKIQSFYDNFIVSDDRDLVLHRRDRLLGVSLTGVMTASPDQVRLIPKMADYLYKCDLKLSGPLFGVAPSSRITVVKPSGTVSLVAGVSAGAHPWYAKTYWRNVREKNPIFWEWYAKVFGIEPHVDPFDNSSRVLSFPITAPDGSVTWQDDDAVQKFLNTVIYLTDNWIPFTNSGFTNSVSGTCVIRNSSDIDLVKSFYRNRATSGLRLPVGMTFLAYSNGYHLAPFEPVSADDPVFASASESVAERYVKPPIINSGKTGLDLYADNAKMNIADTESAFCDGEYCVIK